MPPKDFSITIRFTGVMLDSQFKILARYREFK